MKIRIENDREAMTLFDSIIEYFADQAEIWKLKGIDIPHHMYLEFVEATKNLRNKTVGINGIGDD